MTCRRALWILLSWLWLSTHAWAAPLQEASKTAAKAPRPCGDELILALQGGPFWSDEDREGLFGLTLLVRHGLLEVAGAIDFQVTHPDVATLWNEALRVGLGWQSRVGLRLDLLGVIGADSYHSIADWSVGDPGTSAFRGFGGLHAGASYLFARAGQGQFILGAFGFVEGDFDRSTEHYTYEAEDGSEMSAQHPFGMTRFGVLLSLGMSFDIDLHLPF
jgi:hypothetical protein